MTPTENTCDASAWQRCEPPVLIVSTNAGRGMYSVGEAIREGLPAHASCDHICIEDYLPADKVAADLTRYQWICRHVPTALALVYSIPWFYFRKYAEQRRSPSDLFRLADRVREFRPRTVICISHRAAFWLSNLKRSGELAFALWGVNAEYGPSLGWRYLFWDQIDVFLSPIVDPSVPWRRSSPVKKHHVELPAGTKYHALAAKSGDPNCVLLIGGYWGLGPLLKIARSLRRIPGLKAHVVCGANRHAYVQLNEEFDGDDHLIVHGQLHSLLPFYSDCASVITKPGISSLLEARAARRKIFLLPGLPIAEGHNAKYALEHFDAEWFDQGSFCRWRDQQIRDLARTA